MNEGMRRGRVERERKFAKGTIEKYAEELLARRNDPDVKAKLLAVEAIALRMNWKPLYDRLHFRSVTEPESVPERDRSKPWIPYAD